MYLCVDVFKSFKHLSIDSGVAEACGRERFLVFYALWTEFSNYVYSAPNFYM